MSNKILIRQIESKEGIVYLPQSLQQEAIKDLRFGKLKCQAEFKLGTDEEALLISKDVWELLGLPIEQEVHYRIKEDSLEFFPLVGIFTTLNTNNFIRPIGERTGEFAKLINLAKKYGIMMYVFSPEAIHWDEETMTGIFYERGQWITKTVPFPHVIYDRVPNRRMERKDSVQEAKNKLTENHRIPWFNSGFLNKWTVYRKLNIHASSSQFLPDTLEQPTKQKIATFLDKYGTVYLKPKNSSRGMGIQQIIVDQGQYYCRFHEDGQNKLRRYKSLEDLIQNQISDELFPHLILQQGVRLIEYNKRSVDFRVHTNKDANGEWQVSAAACKVAGDGSVTTHVTYGGEIKTLHEIFGDRSKEYLEKLSKVALIISRVIDQQIDGSIGELGLDLGIDQNDQIYVFEANSKPGNIIFSSPRMKKQEAYTKKILFDYCLYLANRSQERKHNLITHS